MAFALTRYTGDGSTATFSIPWSYRATSDVVVKVAGTTKTVTTHYTFPTTASIQFTGGNIPTSGQAIEIRRVTSHSARIVDYVSGATLTETDLDNDSTQAFNMSQEAMDYAQDSIAKNSSNLFDAVSTRIINVTDPTNAQDAATKNWVDAQLAPLDPTVVAGHASTASTQAGIATAQAAIATTKAAEAAASAASAAPGASVGLVLALGG